MTVCNKQALSVFVLAFSGDILRQFEHMPEPDPAKPPVRTSQQSPGLLFRVLGLAWLGLAWSFADSLKASLQCVAAVVYRSKEIVARSSSRRQLLHGRHAA
mmetsp:Transcript_7603/g.15069  ORF Transcript_7603/g.15069 Transcript_7603/m.15069 type:complete len:101 (-) Transcript_7603:212-514(-)